MIVIRVVFCAIVLLVASKKGEGFFNFPHPSFIDLVHSVHNNSTVTIANDVLLTSRVSLQNLVNIRFIGFGKSTVKCTGAGGVNFVFCNNVVIESINWEGCGFNSGLSYAGINFASSTNILIQNCSFYNSKGHAVSLSRVSGHVHINNVVFANNKYEGHGSALHCLGSKALLIVNDSTFIFNKVSKSVFYIIHASVDAPPNCTVINSLFISNRGVPIYNSDFYLRFVGSVLFIGNSANTGGGIYSSNSVVTFDNTTVSFTHNKALEGGAIYTVNSSIIFDGTSDVII